MGANQSPGGKGPIDDTVKATLGATAGLVGGLIGSAAEAGKTPPGAQQKMGPQNIPSNIPSNQPGTTGAGGLGGGQVASGNQASPPMPVGPSNSAKKGAKKRTVNKQPPKGQKSPPKQVQEQPKKSKEPDPEPTPPKAAAKKSSTKSLKDYRPMIVGDRQPELLRSVYKDLEFEELSHSIFIPKFEGYENVYFVHPVTQPRAGPASIDFSLTRSYSGTLHLWVKNYPFRRNRDKAKGSIIKIKTSKNGREVPLQQEEIPIQDEWTELEIEFDHQTLRIEQVGLDGDCDGLFVRWEFEEKGAEK